MDPFATHTETLDCQCKPERRAQVGGGHVLVHRPIGATDGRRADLGLAPDRHCTLCGAWHFVGHEHLGRMKAIGRFFDAAIRSATESVDLSAPSGAVVAFLVR